MLARPVVPFEGVFEDVFEEDLDAVFEVLLDEDWEAALDAFLGVSLVSALRDADFFLPADVAPLVEAGAATLARRAVAAVFSPAFNHSMAPGLARQVVRASCAYKTASSREPGL